MEVSYSSPDDLLEFEDEEEDNSPLWLRILCCTCCFRKRITTLIQLRKKIVHSVQDLSRKKDELNLLAQRTHEQIQLDAAIKIQSGCRGYLGRKRALNQWKMVVEKADEYWFEVIRKRQEEIDRRNLVKRVRAQVNRTMCAVINNIYRPYCLSFNSLLDSM